ncbi:hypothetical protein UR09_02615 [Candidatus Nitromaritima sp. SCGC AAA799-A02]|nr:hypothetical protein UR09_02615 [Candidatus Nitromaritima sp. SCGC AAA799-A02]
MTHDVGLLGQTLTGVITDSLSHRLKLLSVKKCPSCANSLNEKSITQTCAVCEEPTFAESGHINEYVAFVDKRFKKALIISFIVGLIPVIGSIATIVYSRITLVRPYSQYIPFGKGLFLRALTKIGIFIMFVLQPFPVVGFLACPAITLIYHFSWKNGFDKEYSLA